MKKIILLILINIFFCSTTLYAANLDGIVIEGWSFEKIVAGEKAYSIQADKASFGTKRIGFFNFGLIKVMNLENVLLITYNNGNIARSQRFNRAIYELNSKRLLDDQGNVVFSEN